MNPNADNGCMWAMVAAPFALILVAVFVAGYALARWLA